MKNKTPLTPQQAINNFKLFLELSPRNSYEDYRAAVRELAQICLELGIEGDDKHKSFVTPHQVKTPALGSQPVPRHSVASAGNNSVRKRWVRRNDPKP